MKTGNSMQTISGEYRKLNAQFHDECAEYGTSGQKYADHIKNIAEIIEAKTILDYGAGKCTLKLALPEFDIKCFDPCIPGISERPSPADLVICTDVLEHVESQYIDAVISDLKSLTKIGLYLYVATTKASKLLPDGRNAHISIHDRTWWLDKFSDMRGPNLEFTSKGFKAFFFK